MHITIEHPQIPMATYGSNFYNAQTYFKKTTNTLMTQIVKMEINYGRSLANPIEG